MFVKHALNSMMHYNTRVNKIIEEQYMSYKVLNTISTKNLSVIGLYVVVFEI